MAQIERMTVTFPEPMAAKIRAAVESGDYASTSEVVRDAVRQYFKRPEFTEGQIRMLRQAWDEGIASGDAGEWNVEAFLKEMHETHALEAQR